MIFYRPSGQRLHISSLTVLHQVSIKVQYVLKYSYVGYTYIYTWLI